MGYVFVGTEDDLEYFISHCGEICGIAQKLPECQRTAKNILELTLMELVELKKMNVVGYMCFIVVPTRMLLSPAHLRIFRPDFS